MSDQQSVNLDLLRSAAVILVLAAHLIRVFDATGSPFVQFWGIQNLGTFGVLMFFIHTSLVLMMSLDRLAATRTAVIPRFYIRRMFRIYPLSIVAVAIVLLLRIPPDFEPVYSAPGLKAVWSNLLLVQNIAQAPSVTGPLWSLPFEVQMYLLFPFLYFLAARVRSHAAALLLIASGVIVSNLESRVAHHFGYPALLGYSAWFCMGVAAYSISKRARATLSPKLYGCVLTVFAFSPCITHQVFSSPRSGWMLIAMGAVFALALPYFSEVSSPVVKKISHLVATYSYGIYLAHVPILWFAFRQLANDPLWLRITLFAGLMAVVPVGLYHAVELPLIRAGGRIADKLGRRKITSAMSTSA